MGLHTMISEVNCASSLVHATACESKFRQPDVLYISILGQRKAFHSSQPLAMVGSAACCHFRVANLPAVACVLYHCGSVVLFCDLTRNGRSALGLKIRSSTKLELQGHELSLEFSPSHPGRDTQTWPQIEFFHRDWSERRQLSSEIATIGSDYPSHYRLRGSSLDACHAVLFWHDTILRLVDLSEPDREWGPERIQQITPGSVRSCREVGLRFYGVAGGEHACGNMATDRRMELTQRRCLSMDRLNTKIVEKFALRSMKSTHFRRTIQLSLLLPVIVMAGMYGFQLLRLLINQ